MKSSLIAVLCLAACGGESNPDPTPDAPDSPACTTGPVVERTRFVDESIAYLRSAFDVTTGFDGGSVAYGEGWVSLNDGGCPLADWTTLAYVVDVDPLRMPIELRTTHTRVAAVWALNGRKFIAYLPAVDNDAAPWWQGFMPDNSTAIANRNAPQADVDRFVAQLTTDHPTIRVTWLDAIGILTLETTIGNFAFDDAPTGRIPAIEAATEDIRTSGLFGAVEWSGFIVRIPFESFPAATVDDAQLAPECLRTHTKAMRDGNMFTTQPGFAAPLGTGPIDNPNACN